ncbi:unnamed protein product [Hymenolepis diminuta]|uniref:Recep_L_domain domain-containing protein n=1 Tax=Hymenolepis diminuta TaxID=6216 RepID=A0A0R3SL66_HYMDI|nr:unnamed protein product [Hymenolepis diminuta]
MVARFVCIRGRLQTFILLPLLLRAGYCSVWLNNLNEILDTSLLPAHLYRISGSDVFGKDRLDNNDVLHKIRILGVTNSDVP